MDRPPAFTPDEPGWVLEHTSSHFCSSCPHMSNLLCVMFFCEAPTVCRCLAVSGSQ